MPNQQINSITSATTTDGSELLPVVSGGVTKSVSVSTINSGIAADAVSDVYEARDLAVGQSSIAAAAALAAGSIAQQDLTAVSAALHRSPNAVTSMFVYDTTKDSDGGAWTEKCQHTSWYNEPLSGKWLGAQQNEFQARNINSSLGPELVSNGNFSNGISGWEAVSITGTASISESNGVCNINLVSGFNLGIATTTSILTAGKIYRVEFNYTKGSVPGDSLAVGANAEYTMPVYNGVNSGYFYATTSGKLTIRSIGAFTLSPGVLFSIDNISVREVTALNTTSGDYFQLTTDGKFYRLWKNLYKYSQQFDISPWVTNNTATVSANVATAPDGTQTADALYETTATSSHYVMQDAPVIAGLQYTVQFRVAPNGRTRVAIAGTSSIGGGIGAGIFFELIGVGSVIGTPAGTATIKQDAAGFYLISYTWTAANTGAYSLGVFLVDSGTQTSYTGDPTKGVYLWGAQFEQNSTATSYELKTVDGTISEVFRGNKREFPKLSAIVAEVNSGRNTVAIYDLTEPGRPMWASYYYSPQNQWLTSALCAMNGVMFFGGYATPSYSGSGFFEIDFIRSNSHFTNGGAGWVPAAKVNITSGDISTKPGTTATRYTNQTFYGEVTQVSMCVLPGTPDTISGLPMPTIAAITSGWQTKTVYVITHDGKVCRSNNVGNDFKSIKFNEKHILANAGTSWYSYLNPATINANFTLTATAGDSLYAGSQKNVGKRSHSARVTGNSLNPFVFNETAVQKSINATITNTYNTGHMVGDIRRTYLSSNVSGDITTTSNLVINGDFSVNSTDGWVKSPNHTLTVENQQLKIASSQYTQKSYYAVPTIPGCTYVFSVLHVLRSGGNGVIGLYFDVSLTTANSYYENLSTNPDNTTYYIKFDAKTTTTYIALGARENVGYQIFDNVYLALVESDRSSKNKTADITGTLTKTAVATAAQLVSYSNFGYNAVDDGGDLAVKRNMALQPLIQPILFGNNEQGVWYDPSDMTTLYQDAAGTTPVTAVEQPVGLMLDKSKGLVLGPELVTNGDFSNGSTGWTGGSVSSGRMVVPLYNESTQAITLVAGRTYQVIFDIDASLGMGRITVGGSLIDLLNTTKVGARYYIAPADTTALRLGCISGTSASYDNISVRELPGNHAFQSTSANRPTLSARYNLLTKTEQFDDVVWTKFNSSMTANATVAPDGTTTADKLITVSGQSDGQVYQSVDGAYGGVSFKAVFHYKKSEIATANIRIRAGGSTGGGTLLGSSDYSINLNTGETTLVSDTLSATITSSDIGSGWYRIALTATMPPSTVNVRAQANSPGAGNGTSGIYIWGADLRVANDALNQPAYQRVNTSTDYDTVNFRPYLSFNGTSSSMQTNSIDFTYGDKMFVSAGVRKLSDAAAGSFLEFGNSGGNWQSGSFGWAAPSGTGARDYQFVSRGASAQTAPITPSSYQAPITNVVSSESTTASASSYVRGRVNGVQVTSSTVDQGGGNYGNYPLYIGARAGTSLFFNGRLYQMIIRGAQTSAAQITTVETYINQKTLAY